MVRTRQAGFTLIELIIVIAISSALILIIFLGQRALRSQITFNSTIDRVVSNINDAHNQSNAGLNTVGVGDGGNPACAGPSPGKFVFAGIEWDAADAASGATFDLNYYVSEVNSQTLQRKATIACVFQNTDISPGITTHTSVPDMRLLFIRDESGTVRVCQTTSAANVTASFGQGACVAPATPISAPVTLTITDLDGHSSQIEVTGSGLARRLN